jgi:ABC-type transport system involved in cytochrome bd biosynthesis fused ATPase/permease subunit
MHNTTCFGFLLCAFTVALVAVALMSIDWTMVLIVLGVILVVVVLIAIGVASSEASKARLQQFGGPAARGITQST